MLALGIESESDDVRKDMVKRLERQKIQAAFRNMRDAGIKSFAFFIFGYPGETRTVDGADDGLRDWSSIRISRTSIPAVPYPGTALYEKAVRDGLLRPEDADWSKMEYSYYLLSGNGLDEKVVMDAINRAKRRFFMRPAYVLRHAGDLARLALTKQSDRLADPFAHPVRRARGRHRRGAGRSARGRQYPLERPGSVEQTKGRVNTRPFVFRVALKPYGSLPPPPASGWFEGTQPPLTQSQPEPGATPTHPVRGVEASRAPGLAR